MCNDYLTKLDSMHDGLQERITPGLEKCAVMLPCMSSFFYAWFIPSVLFVSFSFRSLRTLKLLAMCEKKFGERGTEEWAKRSGLHCGAHQSQFTGYLFAVLVMDLIYLAKAVAMWSKMTRHMKTWFCAGKSLLKPVYPTRYYKVIWTECKLFLKV